MGGKRLAGEPGGLGSLRIGRAATATPACYLATVLIDIEHRSYEASLARCAELGGADLIFTSPPYPTEKPGAPGREGAPTRVYGGDAPLHFLWDDYQRLGDLCFAALKPGGFLIVIIDGPVRTTRKHVGSERSIIAFEVALDWRNRVGFRYVEHEAYLREGAPGDFFPRWRSGWEPMHVLQRPGARGYFNPWAYTIPAKSFGTMKKNMCGSMMWRGKVSQGKRNKTHHRQGASRTLTSAISATSAGPHVNHYAFDREHPAPFTRRVAEAHVCCYCPPGGLVCDPFNGSGTTGIVAATHGRRFVGGDLGARERDGRRWADIGRERAEAAAVVHASDQGTAATSVPGERVSVAMTADTAAQLPLLWVS